MDTQFSNKQIHKIFGGCMAYILSRLRHTQKKKEKINELHMVINI